MFIKFVISHKFLHSSFAYSVCVEYLEEFLELIFLCVISCLNEYHLFGTGLFSEVNEVKECGFSELVN